MLVKKPLPPGDPQQYARMQCVALGTLAALGPKQSAAAYLASQGADSALEVQITKASLEGKDGIDSPLTLCIEARALLYRTRDGRPIYSCPVQYRSEEHKFTQWAAHDGKLFREEMANCSRQFGEAISSELVAQHVVRPRSQPMIASAEK